MQTIGKIKRSKIMFFGFSPWLVIGVTIVLGLVILVLAARNTEREKQFVSQSLLERANALIWALEAGTRTWMGFKNETSPLQLLLDETIKQPGIIYLAITDKDGNLIAYSSGSSETVTPEAREFALSEPAVNTVQWRTKNETMVFEVYRLFEPLATTGFEGQHHNRQRSMGSGHVREVNNNLWNEAVVFVGLDRAPYQKAWDDDLRNNVITAIILGVLGFAGFVSLFWAYNYRRSRRLLKNSRALATEVVTSLPLGLITSDTGGGVSIVNATALSMLGLSQKQVLDKPLADIAGIGWEQALAALKRNEKVIAQEIILTRVDGPMPVSLSASPILDEDGLLLGQLFIMHDLTEVKRLQNEVKRNERLTALGNLAAGVAHEIRNPLSSIKGLATYIAGKKSAGIAEAAQTMITEVDRLNGVVSELLEFARPAAITKSRQDINRLVNEALRLVQADICAKNIEVELFEDKTMPLAMVNPAKLTQALLNLFINAVQAMEPAGKLQVMIKADESHTDFSISIKDDGCGIDEKIQAALFTPYFTTKPGGTGLGLAIADQIVEAHGGMISLTSAPDVGSTFTITLPME